MALSAPGPLRLRSLLLRRLNTPSENPAERELGLELDAVRPVEGDRSHAAAIFLIVDKGERERVKPSESTDGLPERRVKTEDCGGGERNEEMVWEGVIVDVWPVREDLNGEEGRERVKELS